MMMHVGWHVGNPHIDDGGTSCSSGCHSIGIISRILMSMTKSYYHLSVSSLDEIGVVNNDAITSLRFGFR